MKKILILVVLSVFVATMAFAQKQKTLRVVTLNHVFTDAMEEMIPEFEKQTGIKVIIEKYGEDQLGQKLTTEFTAGKSNIDVFATRPLQEAKVMHKNKWYTDLAPYIKKNPAYDFDDFTPGARETVTINGFITSIPLVNEAQVLYYRKDILEKNNIKVPETIDELYAAAEKLTDKKNEFYGFVARGQRSPLITQFSSFLFSYGGDFFDQKTLTATVNTPEALAAMDMYGKLLRNFGPEGVLNMSWPQAVAVFAQGKAALYTDASSLYPNMLDPAKSTVADKTGVAVFPAGPKGARMYNISQWALAINSTSTQKDDAWKFIEFMSSKKGITFMQGERAVQSARASVWATKEGTKNFPADWAKAVAESADGIPYDRPQVVAVGQARDIIGEAVVAAIEGKDYKKAANDANKRFQQLLDKEK